jgi:hypothetical protein
MNYPDAESSSLAFANNHFILKRLARGISDAQSIIPTPFPGNSFNWVFGHLVAKRQQVLLLLGAPPVWDPAERERYETDSAPVTGMEGALPMARLIADLDLSQQKMIAALREATPEDLARISGTDRDAKPVGQRIAGLHWHETYHLGQLDLLRSLALQG